jgi:hypothetical protein
MHDFFSSALLLAGQTEASCIFLTYDSVLALLIAC